MFAGEQVRLRALEITDIDNIMTWLNDPEVTRYLLVGTWPSSRESELQWVQRNATSSDLANRNLVIETLDGTYLGGIGLESIDFASGTGELGIVIGRKDYWSKGYGADALRVLIRHAFNSLRLRKVTLKVFGSNVRAQKCYAKLGFKEVGRLKEQVLKEGHYEDEILMELFREDFERVERERKQAL